MSILSNSYHLSLNPNPPVSIAICGTACAGKDALADALRNVLSNRCGKVDEFARLYIEKHGPLETAFQQHMIVGQQQSLEASSLNTYEVTITSSPLFLGMFYTQALLPRPLTSAYLDLVAEHYKIAVKSLFSYTYIILCDPIEEYDRDGVRYQSPNERTLIHDGLKNLLETYRVDFLELPSVSLSDRIKLVLDWLPVMRMGDDHEEQVSEG